MGSRIAAHFANAGIPARLLDLTEEAARKGLDAAAKQKPVAFFSDAARALVTTAGFDDLQSIADCDWVIEAVTEKLEVKRALWSRVAAVARPETVLSTNTSGIPLHSICDGFSAEFRRNFLGTHFFNPPRYLHLVEVIPGPDTDPAVLKAVGAFCDVRLGKGVVPCKDTPNFIANRIGSFYGSTVYKYAIEDDFSIEEVDVLTGPLIGVPKSASFRLLDIVGLDVWAFVSKNLYELVPDDPWRERFLPPPFMSEMLSRGWLGEKAGQGFYKRVGPQREIHALDWKSFEYRPAWRVKPPAAADVADLPARLKTLVNAQDRAGSFLWRLFRDVLLYSAERIPEISDRVVEIDRAMRWGYGHTYGPFELWDALGFTETCDRIEQDGFPLPTSIARMRQAGAASFYLPAGLRTEYFDLGSAAYRELEERPGILQLHVLKRAHGVVKSSAGASLVDLGDGVLCCEFHSKVNALGEDAISMLHAGLEETERNFEAMVVANQGEHFSAGADLLLLLSAIQNGDWDDLDGSIRRFQQCHMGLKYAAKPVVAAPFGRTLGGGAEVVLHATRSQASAELYMGLVEVGVGLIPAAGGCKETVLRLKDPRRIFELIGTAKVSGSAAEAQDLGLLHKADGITMNPERLLADAKRLALSLVSTHAPGAPRTNVPTGGEAAYAAMKLAAWSMKEAGYISDHDFAIAEKLAFVISGAKRDSVTEQDLLDLEREAFLSLCGTEKTQARIQHMLKTGQPLRN